MIWAECNVLHGLPRHSQSQGSVERSNKTDIIRLDLKRKIKRNIICLKSAQADAIDLVILL